MRLQAPYLENFTLLISGDVAVFDTYNLLVRKLSHKVLWEYLSSRIGISGTCFVPKFFICKPEEY